MKKSLHRNNLYLGDPKKLKPVDMDKVLAEHAAKMAAADTMIPVRLYVAQHNFVDTEPQPNTVQLPGQPVDTAGDFVDVEVAATGSTFLNVLLAAQAKNFITGLAISEDTDNGTSFLNSFEYPGRIAGQEYHGATFTSITNEEYTMAAQPVEGVLPADPLTGAWVGWGITYYNGIERPATFDTYPMLAINKYPIYQYKDEPISFVLDFTKTTQLY